MNFALTRHCQTDWNIARRLQGHTDIELNTTGRIEAAALVEKVRTIKTPFVVSSNLKRASETAAIIANRLGAPTRQDERLRECSLGRFEGLTWQEISEKLGIEKKLIYQGPFMPYDFRPYGGESREEVIKRHRSLLNELVWWQRPGETILLVGHGTGLNTLLSSLGDRNYLAVGDVRILEYAP